MCIAVPAEIEELLEGEAIVNYNGVKVKANIMFIENPKVGDYVLVHAGCAIQKIDKDYAVETLEIFNELSNAIKECRTDGHAKRIKE